MCLLSSDHVSSAARRKGCLLGRSGLSAELQVHGGLEEARVAVLLHQGVDFGLGQVKTGRTGIRRVLLDDGFGHVVQIYLSWRIRADELIINLLRFGGQLGGFSGPEVLAGQVEGDVFLTELADEERSEQAQSVLAGEQILKRLLPPQRLVDAPEFVTFLGLSGAINAVIGLQE